MSSYYRLEHDDSAAAGIARAPEGYSFLDLAEGVEPEHWRPVTFSIEHDDFVDFQPNDLGWPLCSQKMKDSIDGHAARKDYLSWLPVIIAGSRQVSYHVLHLPERPDVLDSKKTVFASGGFVVKPWLDHKLIAGREVFSYASGEFSVIVSERIKNALLSANCTGIEFVEMPVSKTMA